MDWFDRFLESVKARTTPQDFGFHCFYWREIYLPIYAPIALELANKFGTSARTLLDCGAGYGFWSLFFAKINFSVTAVDIDPKLLEALKTCAEELRLPVATVPGPLEKLEFPDETFDVSFSFATIHVVNDPDAAAREMARVTRRGGYLAFCFGNPDHGLNQLYWKNAKQVKRIDKRRLTDALSGTVEPAFEIHSRTQDPRFITIFGNDPIYQFEVFRKL